MKKISILGSTGSIGTQTLDIVRNQGDIQVTALAAGSNIDLLEKQIREFRPSVACVWDSDKARQLKGRIADLFVKVVSGMEGLTEAAVEKDAQIVVTAVVGMIGIRPTIEAMKAGKDIALANKETLVTAGHLIKTDTQNSSHSLRRSVSGKNQTRDEGNPGGGCLKTSELEYGKKDYH